MADFRFLIHINGLLQLYTIFFSSWQTVSQQQKMDDQY